MNVKKITSIFTAMVCAASICVGYGSLIAEAETYSGIMQYGDYLSYEQVDEDDDDTYDYVRIVTCDTSVTEVDIPAEIDGLPVKEISGWAFEYCTSLKSVIIPNSVTTIKQCAFISCSNLESITIPDSVASIGGGVFDGTLFLEAKKEENPLVVINDILIDGTSCHGDIVIPDNVTSIGDGAFFQCTSLTSIIIPDSVMSIGGNAFYECTNLTGVTIGSGVSLIGYLAFSCCSSLTNITIPANVAEIRIGAFCHCDGLENITVLNPECEIADYKNTICNSYEISPPVEKYGVVVYDNVDFYDGTIYGYENSTAQAYAEKYGYDFAVIGSESEIRVADVVSLQKYMVGAAALTESKAAKYDLTGDGVLNAFDVVAMKRMIIGI